MHGPALHHELELMQQAGFSPRKILVTATRNDAIVMARERDIGTLQPGKLADMVILNADPLEDIRHTCRIVASVKGSVLYQPNRMLREIELAGH